MKYTKKEIELFKKRYAELVIKLGIALKKDHPVTITCGPANYDFALYLAESAYKNGASYVEINQNDLYLLSLRQKYQTQEQIIKYPSYLKARYDCFIEEDWSTIRIDDFDGQLQLQDADNNKLTAYSKAMRNLGKNWSSHLMTNKNAWCVICAPSPKWATYILEKESTADDLWELLVPILKLDTPDCIQSWIDFNKKMEKEKAILNSLKIEKLHFTSPITDLMIGFKPEARWTGGTSELPDKRNFFPNIPSLEIFTTPDMMQCEGYVTSTRPVSVMNKTTKGVRFTFHKGKVTSVSAEEGEKIISKFIEIPGASRLGECALIDERSEISASNKVFGSILYDENASCHIALGNCYTECLSNEKDLVNNEQLKKYGCNQSLMHTDFMIGSKDTNIDALTFDGKTIAIMRKGEFVFNN